MIHQIIIYLPDYNPPPPDYNPPDYKPPDYIIGLIIIWPPHYNLVIVKLSNMVWPILEVSEGGHCKGCANKSIFSSLP